MRKKIGKKRSTRVPHNKGKGVYPVLLHVRVTRQEKAFVARNGGSELLRRLVAAAVAAARPVARRRGMIKGAR